jgi:hypothetical protein
MTRTLLGLAVLVLVAGCGTNVANSPQPTTSPRPAAKELPAEVLSFQPDGSAPKRLAAISDAPIRLDAFAGWYAGAETLGKLPEEGPAKPDTSYLAATDATGCRTPDAVRVTRSGTDLVVKFTGGTDHPECLRPVGPVAYLALPAAELSGVRTVNGQPPVDAAGPGKLVDFVPLGPVRLGPAAAELGNTAALRTRLSAAHVYLAGDVQTAVDRKPAASERGFVFVLTGCQEKSAVLLVSHQRITADLVRTDRIACAAPEYFLATFTAPTANVPDGAVLTPH